jgi:hypothetical protein
MIRNGATAIRRRRKFLVLVAPTVIALASLYGYAFQYLSTDPERLGIFWPYRHWLHFHIAGGIVALLTGPVQMWLGPNRQYPLLHRVLGVGYVLSGAIACIAGFQLAANTGFGWVFGMGFSAMAAAWLVTTGLAIIAIYRRNIEQHKSWMIRSYTVTFGFVTYRFFIEVFRLIGVGTTVEQLTAASWAGWSIPLLIVEAVLQGREIFAPRESPQPAPVPRAQEHEAQLLRSPMTYDN